MDIYVQKGNRRRTEIMEEKSGKMKVVALYRWDAKKEDWVQYTKEEVK